MSWAVLFGAVNLGVRVPSQEVVTGIAGRGGLDYGATPRGLPPLSDAFIERILGRAPGSVEAPELSPVARAEPRLVGGPADREVFQHTLTNDDSDRAVPISSIPFSARSNTAASTRGDDPTDCGSAGGTVWYRYTPPRDLGLVAYTFGTDHAVALGVFERTADGWRSLGCEQDDGGNALLTFRAAAGTPLYFQVSAPAGGGNLRFNLDPRGTMTLLTRASDGEPANGDAWGPVVSADWRYVAFVSNATNLVPHPPCRSHLPYSFNEGALYYNPGSYHGPCLQIFVLDRITGRTTIASSAADGTPGNHDSSLSAALSGNGNVVVFTSLASNLGPDDPPGKDLFLKDLRTGQVELIASAPPEELRSHADQNAGGWSPAESDSGWKPAISDDGSIVAFQTAVPLDPRDDNGSWDLYVYDRAVGRYELVSVAARGSLREPTVPRDGFVLTHSSGDAAVDMSPSMSPDGRFIVFRSPASDLVRGDENHTWDTFVRDRLAGVTERISVSSTGEEGNGPSVGQLFPQPRISADGRFVVFDSLASNFMPGGQDRPGTNDAFLRDRLLGTTTAFGIDRDRDSLNDLVAHYPSIARNGRFIGYTNWGISKRFTECSGHDTPVEVTPDGPFTGDLYECTGHVFVYDRWTDTTFPVTVLPSGKEWWGAGSVVSENGARVVFGSYAESTAGERVPALQLWLYEAPRAR